MAYKHIQPYVSHELTTTSGFFFFSLLGVNYERFVTHILSDKTQEIEDILVVFLENSGVTYETW